MSFKPVYDLIILLAVVSILAGCKNQDSSATKTGPANAAAESDGRQLMDMPFDVDNTADEPAKFWAHILKPLEKEAQVSFTIVRRDATALIIDLDAEVLSRHGDPARKTPGPMPIRLRYDITNRPPLPPAGPPKVMVRTRSFDRSNGNLEKDPEMLNWASTLAAQLVMQGL